MRKSSGFILLFACFLGFTACKSPFEKIRTSGNGELILNTAFKYYEKKNYQRALTLFELVINTLRGDARAEKAYYEYAQCHYQTKQYLLAAFYFKNFSNTFTNSPLREEAAFMSAYSNYQMSPSFRLEQSATISAIEEFQVFVNLFPSSTKVGQCNELIDELRRKLEQKAFAEGQLYYDLKQFQSAVISFDNLLRDYPESPDAERVRFLIAKASFLLAENSVVEKKVDRYGNAMTRCNDFLEKYPSGKYVREIKDIRKSAESAQKGVRKKLKNV
ncbi:MAG: outer membrane protein assembly factor BamD [Saprospiraceae bacterium]|nr:outer membrane protein assembly factor BamD [Saprospiraceae bacterium]